MAVFPISGPIPGQSLTREPGSAPWERPSKYSDPLDALEMHMENLSNEDVLEDVFDMLTIGVPISVVAGTMLGMAVMDGYHTVDVKVLLRPILSAYIKNLADAAGIEDYKMSMADYRDKDEEAKKRRSNLIAAKLESKMGGAKRPQDEGDRIVAETQQQLESGSLTAEPAAEMQEAPVQQQEMPMEAEAPKGLMARG